MKSSQNDSQMKFLSKELVTSPSAGNNQPLLREVGLPPPPPPLKKKRKFRESKLINAKTYKSLFSIKKKPKHHVSNLRFSGIFMTLLILNKTFTLFPR